MKKLLARRREEKGQGLVEFSFVLMAFLLLIFGIMEGARMFESWVTIQHASREAARWGVTGQDDCTGITDDRLACITATASDRLGTLNGGSGAIIEVSSYDFPDYADPGNLNDPGEACDMLEVHVEYDHQVVLPIISEITGDTVHLETEERMVNEPFASCGTSSS